MNYAVYYVAVGEGAHHCLMYSYRTLRKAGFTGDVYILTDHIPVSFDTSKNTKILKIREADLNLDKNSTAPLAACDVRRFDLENIVEARHPSIYKWAIANMRTLIDSYIPFEQYDHILYLDTDVLVAGSLERFSSFLKNHSMSIITSPALYSRRLGGRGNFSLKKLKRVKTTEAANLTTVELIRHWFVQPICSDIVCFPTNNIGTRFIQTWREECQKGIYQDQAALQAILLRHFKNVQVLAPRNIFGHSVTARVYEEHPTVPKKSDTVFVHFQGALKNPGAFDLYYKTYLQMP